MIARPIPLSLSQVLTGLERIKTELERRLGKRTHPTLPCPDRQELRNAEVSNQAFFWREDAHPHFQVRVYSEEAEQYFIYQISLFAVLSLGHCKELVQVRFERRCQDFYLDVIFPASEFVYIVPKEKPATLEETQLSADHHISQMSAFVSFVIDAIKNAKDELF